MMQCVDKSPYGLPTTVNQASCGEPRLSGRLGNVGGPVTSVETVGVDPDVGGLVTKGAELGGSVLHTSVYSQSPVMSDILPKLALQHAVSVSYDDASAMMNSLEQLIPS